MNADRLTKHLNTGATALGIHLPPNHAQRLARYVVTHTAPPPPPAGPVKLTQQQFEILYGIAHGESMVEASRRLGLSTHTVKTHRRRLYARLGAKNAAHAIGIGFRLGLLQLQSGGDAR
ncbi:LuxR C-terminal-related transcriptional regulator [Streptomyces sp. NPDC006422]|uniref:response regulator transcription factor n=1 Tax=unclassified Streptomyces TaxID=2593676 RepID=UPI0033B46431